MSCLSNKIPMGLTDGDGDGGGRGDDGAAAVMSTAGADEVGAPRGQDGG